MFRHFVGRQVVRQTLFGNRHGQRGYGQTTEPELTPAEKQIHNTLKTKFPGATTINVEDISGGCGAMYQISVEAKEFKGKRTVQQHLLVNEALADEIKDMHGLQIKTKVPES
ncbi:bolA-like protein 3 [Gigantopelta aegis]|uniref:bolA-like protein 3 n=1 Tax=Gigantopelta aegis TaxID=1735272 RepID=UPI001B88DF6C|nr:bolA-like protein 3 [Gigantopelta aegis]